ncbi:MAG: relaxase/mobilization nuclease domain-containing protein [Lachnospiraceae bacterium]
MSIIATLQFHDGKYTKDGKAGRRGYHTLQSLRDLINYITRDDKTQPWLIGSRNCSSSPDICYEEMVLCKRMYDKAQEDGKNRMCIHFSQNLVAGETTPDIAYEIAGRLARHKFFDGFQVIYAVHLDTGNLHTHFCVNSVNQEDGHKWQLSPKQLQELKDYSDEIIKEYGLYVVPKKQIHENNYKSKFQMQMEEQGTSWKYETYLSVKACMEVATSREMFIKEMNKLGYQVDWRDERKYITFTDSEGHKLRNRKLYPQSQFTKEALEKRFALNRQIQQQYNPVAGVSFGLDATYNMLRLANSLKKQTNTPYPMQQLEKNNSSMAAKKERVKENEKGRGIDWEH